MGDLILSFHSYRENKADDENEIRALFLFTLMTAAERQAGVRPDHTKSFWTEVRLSRDLASRGRWPSLSHEDKLKAMFCYAVERIGATGRKIREAPMFWTTQSPLRDGPIWDLGNTRFPSPHAIELRASDSKEDSSLQARKAAGLSA